MKDLLIFLHGFPDTKEIWKDYVNLGKEHYICWTPALPGTEGEKRPKRDLMAFVLDLLRKIKEEKADHIFLVGHDIGAPIAVMLAEHLKSRLSGLVLINGLSVRQFAKRLKNPHQLRKSWYMFVMQPKLLPELLIKLFSRPLLELPKKLKQENFHPNQKGLEAFWTYRDLMKESFVAVKQRGKIKTASLVLWGNRDPFLLRPTKDEFESQFENFEIRILQGDHWFHLADPAGTFTIIDKFFQELR